ncbi:hypothetical protein DB35_08775 [Streptomyces abyssalis]|uniref:N-acetyltransferase domain-containing protein n=2 Tax=Streptomyces abyssalis TaxID=933944 RepID=A0A1E7JS26_9ACTN|nr:hypothetical protein AN215_04040 [Streptomyces abyssalis]OEU94166.1 hypothetical protein DB35_08775 [Streptomyces abyssalis]
MRAPLCQHPFMRVREMTEADIDAVAELRVRAWQSAYADLLPRTFLDAMSVAEDAARRREMFAARSPDDVVVNLVTEDGDGTVTGWAALGPDRPGGAHTNAGPRTADVAELYAIYVRPGLLGTGIGRALTTACLERAAQLGFTRVVLWTIEGNARARRFYELAGFTTDGTQDTFDVDGNGTLIPLVHYARPLAPRQPPPAPPLTDSGSV